MSLRIARSDNQDAMLSVCRRSQTPRNFDGHVIGCPSCGKQEVAGGAWEKFRNASQEERSAALGKAASLKGVARWPTIKNICL